MTKERYTRGIYSICPISPDIYRIENNDVFVDLIVGSHHALLWDTGYGYGDLTGVIRELTELPLYVVDSHGHVDHSCGNWQFPQVWIHPRDMELCRLHNSVQMRGQEPDPAAVPEGFDLETYANRGCGDLVAVDEGHIFDLGGICLEVVALPGHTAGSIGLICRERHLIFLGDAANDFVWLFLPEALPLSVYKTTLEKLMGLDIQWMIQSHCPDPLPGERLKWYMDLVETLDYPAGEAVTPPIETGIEARICIRGGMTLADRGREDFAAILIGQDKLDI